jgi:hypothetical protein
MDTSLFTFGLLPLTCSGAHQWGRPGTSGRAGTRYLSTNADTPIELYIMARSIPSCGWQSAVCQPPRTMYAAARVCAVHAVKRVGDHLLDKFAYACVCSCVRVRTCKFTVYVLSLLATMTAITPCLVVENKTDAQCR